MTRLLALAMLAAALLVGWASSALQAERNQLAAERQFTQLANHITGQIQVRMQTYAFGLRGARGAVAAAGGHIDRAAFARYSASRDLEREFPGARGFGVIWHVPRSRDAAFTAEARRDGWPDFQIRQLAAHDGDRYVIQYVEPVERNRASVGLDIASETNRRLAAEAAARRGEATLTEPITLVQATGQPLRSFLLLLPIYQAGAPVATTDERAEAVIGWVYAPLVIDEVLASLGSDASRYRLSLSDAHAADNRPFYGHAAPFAQSGSGPRQVVTLAVHGRDWQAELQATPAFVASLQQTPPWQTGVAAALITLLCLALARLAAVSAAGRRSEHNEQARRAAIVDASDDALVGVSPAGFVTDWNGSAERLFGWSAAEAQGRPIETLLAGPNAAGDNGWMARIARGERIGPYETLRLRRDGTLIDVLLSAAPIVTADGRTLGHAFTLRDLADARRTERALGELDAVRRAEARLRVSEAFLERAGEIAGVGAWEVDLRTQRVHWSGQTRRIHEVDAAYEPTLEEAIAFYPPGARRAMEEAVQAALAAGKPWDLELPFVTAKGRSLWVRAVGVVETEGGVPTRLTGAFQDITARRRAETLLANERQLMNSLLETLPDQIYFKDRESRFLRINPALARRYGLADPAEAVGRSDADYFTADHAERTAAVERRIVATGEPVVDLEERETWPDRAPTWNLTTKMPLRDAEGSVIGTFGISRDITARKRMEQELQATNERFSLAADSVGLGVWENDLRSGTLAWDDRMHVLYGSQPGEGRTPLEIWAAALHPDDAVRVEAELAAALVAGGPPFDTEFRIRRPDGSVRHVKAAALVLRDEEGRASSLIGVNFDVTERARAEAGLRETMARLEEQEASLRDAVRHAEEASRAKSHFLANVSHEIRTPMNAVIGLTYLLGRTPLDREQAAMLAKIESAGNTLLGLIDDVLDLSKIEAGGMRLERAPFSPADLVRRVAGLMGVQADAKGIRFDVDLPPDLPAVVEGDATRVHQVLVNLLGNAIKFTERGNVRLQAQTLPDATGRTRLRLAVHDTGIGIEAEALGRLFQPFVQADASTTRRFGGTGLGLSIVSELVGLMGGEVGVHSVPGEGSVFHVELSLPVCDAEVIAAPAGALPATGLPALPGIRVLVADDSTINLEVAERILVLEGARVRLAQSGQEAVDAVLAEPEAVDIVLMDVQMPLLDGLDATRRIREGLGSRRLPIVALTAGLTAGESLRAQAAGMDDVIGKPFDPPALVRCMRRHLSLPEMDCVAGGTVPQLPADALPAMADWPAIDGIDAAACARRLGGDRTLFLRLLQRFLRDAESPWLDSDGNAVPQVAARLHRLRGMAGTLGAVEVERLAGDAEAACRSGAGAADPASAATLGRLGSALASLSLAARPMLETLRSREEAALAAACEASVNQPIDRAAIENLIGQLDANDFAAVAQSRLLAGPLRQLIGAERHGALRAHLDDLRFEAAADLLREGFTAPAG